MAAVAGRGVLAAIVLFAMIAAPAQATIRTGEAPDRTGDSSGPAGTDIIKTVVRADDGGRAAIGVQLRATPAAGAWILGLLGTNGASGCGAPYVLFSGSVDAGIAVYQRETADSPDDLKRAVMTTEGTVVALSAEDAGQLALPFDCAISAVSRDGTVANLFDESDAPMTLAAETPAPTPTPAATATPGPVTLPQPVPAPTTATTPPVPVAKDGEAHGLTRRRAVDDPPQPHPDAEAQGRQRRLQALEQGHDQRRQGARAVRAARGDAVRRSSPPRSGPSRCA